MLNYLIGVVLGLLLFTTLLHVSYKDWRLAISTKAHNYLLKDQFNKFLTIDLVSCGVFTCTYKTSQYNVNADAIVRTWRFDFDIFGKITQCEEILKN